jgi:hypothetical protein
MALRIGDHAPLILKRCYVRAMSKAVSAVDRADQEPPWPL